MAAHLYRSPHHTLEILCVVFTLVIWLTRWKMIKVTLFPAVTVCHMQWWSVKLVSKRFWSSSLHFLLLFTFQFCCKIGWRLQLAANLPLEREKQNQQLRCGAIFKHPFLCEPSTRAFLSGIQKKEKNYTQLGRQELERESKTAHFPLK